MMTGKDLKPKEGYQEEIFEFFKVFNGELEILDCNACHIQPEILTIRNYLGEGRTHLMGAKIKCPKCNTFIKADHSSHLSHNTESATAKEILILWNSKMKGNNRWCM